MGRMFGAKFGWSYQALLEMMFGMGLIAVIAYDGFPVPVFSSLIGGGILLAYGALTLLTGTNPHINCSETKFGAILGLFLGFPEVVLCVFLALFAGALLGSFGIKFRRINHHRSVPSFPILIAASGLVTILFGQDILTLYEQLVM